MVLEGLQSRDSNEILGLCFKDEGRLFVSRMIQHEKFTLSFEGLRKKQVNIQYEITIYNMLAINKFDFFT